MIKNSFYSSLNKDIKNNKSFLNKKRKKTAPKYKTKSTNSKNNSKIKSQQKSIEVDNDNDNDKKNNITGEKNLKKDSLKNSNEQVFKIINLKKEGNYIKRKNVIRYNSSKMKIIIENYKKIIY
jgi:hypothetical protein